MDAKAQIERTETGVTVRGENYTVVIAENGMISSIVSDGIEYLKNAVRLQLYRATIDNDMPYLVDWMRERLEFIRPAKHILSYVYGICLCKTRV